MASAMLAPCETSTSTCRSFATISSGLYLFLGISVLLDAKRHSSSRTTSMGVAQRHMRAALKAQINKTDRNDARGMAQMMRAGLYRPVHVKTVRSQKLRMLLTHRKLLQSKAIAVENDLRATLRNFGLKVGMAGKVRFEARIRELVEKLPDLAILVEPLLIVRRTLREQFGIVHRRLLAVVWQDGVCLTPIHVPGVEL